MPNVLLTIKLNLCQKILQILIKLKNADSLY